MEPRTPLFELALRQIVARYDLDTPSRDAPPPWTRRPRALVAPIKNSGAASTRSPSSSPGCVGILDTQFAGQAGRASSPAAARDRGGQGPRARARPARRRRPRQQYAAAPRPPTSPAAPP
ncbi:hypothetical protein SALBM217S_01660 [Streptomyces griseoloalbus]